MPTDLGDVGLQLGALVRTQRHGHAVCVQYLRGHLQHDLRRTLFRENKRLCLGDVCCMQQAAVNPSTCEDQWYCSCAHVCAMVFESHLVVQAVAVLSAHKHRGHLLGRVETVHVSYLLRVAGPQLLVVQLCRQGALRSSHRRTKWSERQLRCGDQNSTRLHRRTEKGLVCTCHLRSIMRRAHSVRLPTNST